MVIMFVQSKCIYSTYGYKYFIKKDISTQIPILITTPGFEFIFKAYF